MSEIGCDLHARQQSVAMLNRDTGAVIAHRVKKAASILCRGLFSFRAHDLRRTPSIGMAEAGFHRVHIAKGPYHVEGVRRQPASTTTMVTMPKRGSTRTLGTAAPGNRLSEDPSCA